MPSKQSDQFLIELRMYLISKGKNDKEIDDITGELEDHLMQAESEGKSIKHITGESPKEYMKSIGQELNTDYRQLAILAPVMILLIFAYFSLAPAIKGTFALSKIGIWVSIVMAVISILFNGFIIVKVLPKLFHSKWFYIVTIGSNIVLIMSFVAIIIWQQTQNIEAFFVATPVQNNLILLACILIIIAAAIYTKTWFTIIVPFFLSIGPIGERFIPESINKDPTYITITIILLVLLTIGLFIFLFRKSKKENEDASEKRS